MSVSTETYGKQVDATPRAPLRIESEGNIAMSNNYEIIAGLDIGNGYVKGKCQINGGAAKLVDMPSCVSYISATSWLPVEPDDKFMADLFNELDCDISSPSIPPQESMRLIYGRRAVDSGNTSVMFNIDDSTPKCEDPLAMQLALGVLASLAAGAYWEEHHEIPADQLNVVANSNLFFANNVFAQEGIGTLITWEGLAPTDRDDMVVRRLDPLLLSHKALIWCKDRPLRPAAARFLEAVKEYLL